MTDRERCLLEQAASAAGLNGAWEDNCCDDRGQTRGIRIEVNYIWNPLDDDGDALRLAVKLRIPVVFDTDTSTIAGKKKFGEWRVETGINDPGGYAATRRAIVRAAAEIAPPLQIAASADESDNLFASDLDFSNDRKTPDCPKCESENTSPDYGIVSWPDDVIPPAVKEGIDKGLTPFGCLSCGHGWMGTWCR